MKPPEEVKLNREEGEALIERLQADRWTTDDRRVVEHVIRFHFWLSYTLRETKISLSRLKKLLFGQGRGSPGGTSNVEGSPGDKTDAEEDQAESPPPQEESEKIGGDPPPLPPTETEPGEVPPPRRGHGRQGADEYTGAQRVRCQCYFSR